MFSNNAATYEPVEYLVALFGFALFIMDIIVLSQNNPKDTPEYWSFVFMGICFASSVDHLFKRKNDDGEYQFYWTNSLMLISQPIFATYILVKGIAPDELYEDVIIMNVFFAYLMTTYLLFWITVNWCLTREDHSSKQTGKRFNDLDKDANETQTAQGDTHV